MRHLGISLIALVAKAYCELAIYFVLMHGHVLHSAGARYPTPSTNPTVALFTISSAKADSLCFHCLRKLELAVCHGKE